MYKWKPNAAQRAAYRQKCEERESLPVYNTIHAIRKCQYLI